MSSKKRKEKLHRRAVRAKRNKQKNGKENSITKSSSILKNPEAQNRGRIPRSNEGDIRREEDKEDRMV